MQAGDAWLPRPGDIREYPGNGRQRDATTGQLLLDRHLGRLKRSAGAIALRLPLDDAAFCARVEETIAALPVARPGASEYYLRVILTRGVGDMGYDPALSVEAAWRLSREVERMENMQSLLAKSDIVTLHLPVLEATRNLINKDLVDSFRPGATLINLSREKVVDTDAILMGLDNGRIGKYITDFPVMEMMGHDKVVAIPHLGASTEEAEENCAIMVADQLIDFLENGNIRNSVNFPNIALERNGGFRLAFSNRNVPKMLNQVLSILADRNINVIDMINKSRSDAAYNIIDIEQEPTAELIQALEDIDGVIKVRTL